MAVSVALAEDSEATWEQRDISNGSINITENGRYKIVGSTTANFITVADNVECDIALHNVSIAPTAGKAVPFKTGDGSNVRLYLYGNNTLTAKSGTTTTLDDSVIASALHIGVGGASLTISGGNGKLTATGSSGGCGVCVLEGASFIMDAESATLIANGGWAINIGAYPDGIIEYCYGSGIGSYSNYNGGDITIKKGTVTAKAQQQGAGIGVGVRNYKGGGVTGNIRIEGGTVTASSGSWGCGIGGSFSLYNTPGRLHSYTQTGGIVNLTGMNAPALGSGSCGDSKTLADEGGVVEGKISISGGVLNAYSGFSDSYYSNVFIPAIGGGASRHGNALAASTSAGEIEITGGIVVAVGYDAGIGPGGREEHAHNQVVDEKYTKITISGGSVYAAGGKWAIGGPEGPNSSVTNLSQLIVKGGCLATKGGLQIKPKNYDNPALELSGEFDYGMVDGCRKLDCFDDRLTSLLIDDGSDNGQLMNIPDDIKDVLGEKWSDYAGRDVLWMPFLPRGSHKLTYGASGEAVLDVSPADGEPIVYDVSKVGVVVLSDLSRNAVATGTENNTAKTNNFAIVGKNAKLALDNIISSIYGSVIIVYPESSLTLTLKGENKIRSQLWSATDSKHSAVYVYEGAALTIEGDGGGVLTAITDRFGAAIGSSTKYNCGAITINSGTVYAFAGMQGAGIGCGTGNNGSGTCGDITINGGTVRACGLLFNDIAAFEAGTSQGTGTGWAAGIGGVCGSSANGGGLKSYTQTGGDVEAYGVDCPGIGGGAAGTASSYVAGKCGPVKITGGRLVADSCKYGTASGSIAAPGIGGGGSRNDSATACSLTSYEQTGGDVTVRGVYVGIGGGGKYNAANLKYADDNTTVKISGGTLTLETKQSSHYAIGGMEPSGKPQSLKSVVITGGSVKVAGAEGFQVAPSNAVAQAVYPATVYKTRVGGYDAQTGIARASFTVGSADTAYTYGYSGVGHPDDKFLYFYLPNGTYTAGNTYGEMVDGEWTRYNGMKFIVR